MRKLMHGFPDRKNYKFQKGKSKYNGPFSDMGISLFDRHIIPVQEFLWIEWAYRGKDKYEKLIKFSFLLRKMREANIMDYSLSSINSLGDDEIHLFIDLLEQEDLVEKLKGFGFLYFGNTILRKTFFNNNYTHVKKDISEYLGEV